jgi:antirestriction protein ArdC
MAAKKRSRSRRPLTEAERAEKRAAERQLMAEAIEQLRSSEGWLRWLGVRRHFHHYSLHNQLLIAFQLEGATRVAGFRRWMELGYCVRKGEHAIRIWAPCPPSKKALRQWKEEGCNPQTEPRTCFRLVAVFDRSQVEPLPDFPGGPVELDPPSEPIAGDSIAYLFEPLAAFGASIGFPVSVEEIPGAALGYCDPGKGKIGVEAISAGFSANAQVAAAVHELAHALVRCDRREADPDLTYAEEEVVVECVAYTVCSTLGLDTSGAAVPYVTGWSKGEEIERYAALIDRLAARLEEVALFAVEFSDEEELAVPR